MPRTLSNADRVLLAVRVGLIISAVSLAALFLSGWFIPGNLKLRGFVGAIGAIFIFGSSSLPAKHSAAGLVGPFRFQLFVTLGNLSMTLLCVLVESLITGQFALRLTAWGFLGATVLTLTQVRTWFVFDLFDLQLPV